MKRYLIVAALLVPLSGCQTIAGWFGGKPTQTTKTTIVEVFADGCHTYAAALNLAAQTLQAGKLTEAQINDVKTAKAIGDPICTGPQPTNLASAFVAVAGATYSIGTATQGAQ
jgi:hypothetical protein